jgi:hypothetical protein
MQASSAKTGVGEQELDLYLFYAEQTEKLIERRNANSRYFLTVNTAFVALLGIAIEHGPSGAELWLLGLPVAGIITCVIWAQLTCSYRSLIKARYGVIHELEARLSFAPYAEEWTRIKSDPAYNGYVSIARLEALVPGIFGAIYLFFLVSILLV